jgi:hypothetical protein
VLLAKVTTGTCLRCKPTATTRTTRAPTVS